MRSQFHRPGEVTIASERRSFRHGVSFGMLSFAVTALLGVVTSIVLARLYGVTVIGEFALAYAPAGMMVYLSTAQEQAALVRELSTLPARAPRVTALFQAVMAFSFALTLVMAVPVLAISWIVLAGPVGRPDLFLPAAVLMASYVFVQNTCWNMDMVFAAFRAGHKLFWIRLDQALVFFAAAIAIGVMHQSVWGLVLATVASWAVALLHRAWSLREFMIARISRRERRDGFRTLPALLRFGLRVVPGTIADGLANEAGTWILGITSPVAAVGAWNRAKTLGSRMQDASTRLYEMLFPTLVERRASGDRAGYDRALIDSIRYALAGMLLVAAAGGGAARGVMDLFGPGFSAGANALALLLLWQALALTNGIQASALWSANRPLVATAAAGVRMAVSLAVGIVASLRFGVSGPAIGLVCGHLAGMLVLLPHTRRQLSQPLHVLFPWIEFQAIVLAYVAGFAGARLVDVTVGGPIGLLVALGFGCLVFALTLVLAGGLNERDGERLGALRSRLARARLRLGPAET
jgi:O-antigen/teichoic acid export membrane protein